MPVREAAMDRFDNMPEVALGWLREGRKVALATVVETWGSAPRRVGSQLAIAEDGAMEGSVSGGCVEGAVVVEALEALAAAISKPEDAGEKARLMAMLRG